MAEKTKTHKYLLPAVVFGYGKKFKEFMTNLARQRYILNTYVDDILQSTVYEESIFILLKFQGSIRTILEEAQSHESYVADYPVGELEDMLHMLVLRIPSRHRRAYSNFMISRYSRMYDREFLLKLRGSFTESTLGVLSKSNDKKKEVMTRFGIEDPNWSAKEYDARLDFKKELYNYPIVTELVTM